MVARLEESSGDAALAAPQIEDVVLKERKLIAVDSWIERSLV